MRTYYVTLGFSFQEITDIYSTNEPQAAFHQRISFCLDIYNQSVKVSSWFMKLNKWEKDVKKDCFKNNF